MTRTSRARIRPFTRICGCRLDQSPHRRNGSAPRRRVPFIAISGVGIRKRQGTHSSPRVRFTATKCSHLKFASRREVVGNNLALARSNSQRLVVDLPEITLAAGRQSALCAPRTQRHRLALNPAWLPMARVSPLRKKWRDRRSQYQSRTRVVA
jgi:hypothetical protein